MTYSWDLVRNRVRDFRTALQMTYPIQVLATVKDFVIDGDSLYFLSNHRITPSICPSRHLRLYTVSLDQCNTIEALSNQDQSDYIDKLSSLPLLQWKPAFSDYSNIGNNNTEQLHIPGMTMFEKLKDDIMFTFNNRIYIGTLGTVPKLIPFRAPPTRSLLIPRSESPQSPQISPIDTPNMEQTTYVKDKEGRADPKLGGHQHIAFIRNRDIWVTDFDGNDTQLTFSSENESDPTLSCGIAEYMMQEEFHRFTGYYWGNNDDDGLERILYLETSEQKVDVISVAKSNLTSTPEPIRYPRAGKPNASSKVKMVEFEIGSQGQFKTIVHKQLTGLNTLKSQFPWMEYITRFGWVPNTKNVWVQLLSRDQKRMALVKLNYSQFINENETQQDGLVSTEVIWEETSEDWINITDVFHFINNETDQDCINLIWSSEKATGYRHLYKVTKYTNESKARSMPLTSGEWCCVDRPIYVDERRHLVYFSAKKDTPLETHLYVLDFRSSLPTVKRLTQLGFSHTVTITSSDYIVDCFSHLHHPPVTSVNKLEHQDGLPSLRPRALLLSVPTLDKKENALDIIPNGEIFDFNTSNGTKLYGCLYKPRDYKPGQSYPTLLHVYGGPKTQLVMNDFKFPRLVRYLMSVYFGFAVVIIDSRGSNDRGIQFEAYIKSRLGRVELKDQMRGLEHVVEHKIGAEPREKDGVLASVVDMSRLAITGWSYGGYLSLMALAQYPEVFKMAIAGAPVTQWELYDAAYTERYMGLPFENASAYEKSSVLHYVDGFPEKENRLLIAHGLIDENVHFLNTESLVSELVKLKKPHYLQVYPTEKHGLRHASVNEHFETLMFYWLVNYL
ncbi:alpha/beta-hydrolase [Backusella circina FSU 941]|nr:alpha/beta-hydrolase [Backusella circina FSU 941]